MLLSKEENVGIIYCGTVIRDDYTKKVRSTRFKKIKGDFRRDILFDNFVVTTSAILVQKAVLREIGGFDETLPSSQDWDLLIRLSKRCTIDYCDDYLLEYHVHSSRVSNRIDDKLRTFHMYKPVLEDYSRSFSASERRKIMGLYYFRMGHQLLKSGSKKESRSYLVSSLRKHPLNSMIVVDLVLSLLPKVITRALLWIKHAIQKGVEIN